MIVIPEAVRAASERRMAVRTLFLISAPTIRSIRVQVVWLRAGSRILEIALGDPGTESPSEENVEERNSFRSV